MAIMKKEMEFFIQTSAVDISDNIKPASVFDYFQDIAGLHAKELGVSYETIKKENLAWVILYETYEIINMPPYLENVVVKTWPKPKGRLEFEREYFMESIDGKTLIKGISNWVLIDLDTRMIARTDRVDYNGEYYDFTNYNGKTKRKIGLDYNKCIDFFDRKTKKKKEKKIMQDAICALYQSLMITSEKAKRHLFWVIQSISGLWKAIVP